MLPTVEDKRQVERALYTESLIDFIQAFWGILEPGRKLVRGWALDAICEHLEAVSYGQIKQLLINVPPGFSKSITTCAFFPAWEWIRRPDLRYIKSSYSSTLSLRDNLRLRRICTSPEYQQLFDLTFSADQNTKIKFENDKTGWAFATSVGGVGTGERADRFILDDPHNVKESDSKAARENVKIYFTEVMPTRMNDENSCKIVIMQRVHEDDVSGIIIKEELGYEHLNLPMHYDPARRCKTVIFEDPRQTEGELLFPERFPADMIRELERVMGAYASAGQLEQLPRVRVGEWFTPPKKMDWSNKFKSVRAWLDPAFGGDNRTALGVMGIDINNRPICKGWTWRKDVTKCYDLIVQCLTESGCGTLYVETNADQGRCCDDLKKLWASTIGKRSTVNKHNKIVTQLVANWDKIYIATDCQAEFEKRLISYKEGVDDDEADTLASLIDEVGIGENPLLKRFGMA